MASPERVQDLGGVLLGLGLQGPSHSAIAAADGADINDWVDVDLFAHLRAVLREDSFNKSKLRVAVLSALSSSGSSGRGVTHDAERIANELGIGRRTAERWLGQLRSEGWHKQTTAPTRGWDGQPGRRARYQLRAPAKSVPDNWRGKHASMGTDRHIQSNRPPQFDESTAAAQHETGPCMTSDGSTSVHTTGTSVSAVDTDYGQRAIQQLQSRLGCDEHAARIVLTRVLDRASGTVNRPDRYISRIDIRELHRALPDENTHAAELARETRAKSRASWDGLDEAERDRLFAAAELVLQRRGDVPTSWRDLPDRERHEHMIRILAIRDREARGV